MNDTKPRADENSRDDSLVGVPEHPVAGVAGGMAAGAASGAMVGTVAGPVGMAIGAVVGAVAGALGGDAIASSVEQVRDTAYWRDNFSRRPYVGEGDTFHDYGPAFDFGEVWSQRHAGRSFDEVEPELAIDWPGARGSSRLEWDRARHAARDAWGPGAP